MRVLFCCLVFFVACSTPRALRVQSSETKLLVKHANDFTITGEGSDPAWSLTSWNNIPQRDYETLKNSDWQIEKDKPGRPVYSTMFKVLYSDKGIYCLYKCEDSAITATIKEDYGALYNEDVVELFLRPDTTLPCYFEYELSPLNYELPIMIINNKGNAMGWKPWHYDDRRKTIHAIKRDTAKTSNGRFTWTAEVFIPYSLLAPTINSRPARGTLWRGNFYRIDYDVSPAYSSWNLTRQNFHDYERFGLIEFD